MTAAPQRSPWTYTGTDSTVKIADLTKSLNAAILTVVMLETPRAIENADAIAAVPGIDVLLIGTNDLCAEMGIPGDFGNEPLKLSG